MSPTSEYVRPVRPPSPWPGSAYQTRHRWQLDTVRSLAGAGEVLRELAGELTTAHTAGWWLVEPMHNGHLLAARASRRQRARGPAHLLPSTNTTRPPVQPMRLRLINEAPVAGDEVFDVAAAGRTPVLAWGDRAVEQVSGPEVAVGALAEVTRQVTPTDLARRSWGLAAARVGRGYDLLADGSALRLHTVDRGALIRVHEVLMFQHCADGAWTLLQAAASYTGLAKSADTMSAASGRLVSVDDGFLHVGYNHLQESW